MTSDERATMRDELDGLPDHSYWGMRVDALRDLLSESAGPWLVVICREGVTEVTPFDDEDEAVKFFDQASAQWSDSYLCRAVRWPRDVHAAHEARAGRQADRGRGAQNAQASR